MYSVSEINRPANTNHAASLWNGLLETGQAEMNVRAGEALFFEGDDADFVYEVLDGVFCCYSLLPDGRRQVTGFVHPGEIIGLGSQPALWNRPEKPAGAQDR